LIRALTKAAAWASPKRPFLGANPAMLTGLLMMPIVVAAGYWADRGAAPPRPDLPSTVELRGSFDPLAASPLPGNAVR
jgi:hypothetical protein